MSTRPRLLTTLLLLLVLVVPGAFAAPLNQPSQDRSTPGPTQRTDRPATRTVPQRWIVRLKDPAMAQAPRSHPGFGGLSARSPQTGRLEVFSSAAQTYRAMLQQQQTSTFATLKRAFPAAQLHRQYQVVFNGFSVAIPGTDDSVAARLRAMPGVAEVYPDRRYEPTMWSSLPLINAAALWNNPAIGGQANAGAGIKIAIIDSGIETKNPFFDPTGFSYPPGYPKGDPAYTTPKVIAARAYFRPDLPPLPGEETPEPGPTASSHGTHVAGTAAGVANTTATVASVTETLSGVAPRAYLMNYKVFYENESVFSGSSFATESIAALEDAVADGADVINNSWGGRAEVEPGSDPIVVAADAAVDAGVTVVFSAGNEGPSLSTTGSPGFSDKLITVGATTTAQTIAAGFADVTAPEGVPPELKQRQYGPAAFGPPIENDLFGPAPYVPVAAIDGSMLACDPLPPDSLKGQIALIERGTCAFSLKVFNAQQAGAIAAMIYNTEAGGEEIIAMGASDKADEVKIPSVFVARSMGVGMTDWYAQHGADVRVQIDPRGRVVDQTPDVLAAFSSRGPTYQGSLKPDVVAPGVNIMSSGFGPGEGGQQHLGFGIVSGTSMAAPHVTGSAALLKQAHRDWSPNDIRSALMSTAVTDVWLDEARTQLASVLERGAGRIDLSGAGDPGLLFDRPGLSFGSLRPSATQPTHAELAVGARNVSGQQVTYRLSARGTGQHPFEINVSPATLTLAPNQSARFTVSIDLPSGAQAGDYEGLVLLDGGPRPLHLPLWARVLPAERGPKVLLIDNDGSSSLELPDYSGYYGNALGELGIPFTYLDVDALAGQAQTLPDLPELQKHEIILWFTGDNFVPSGTFTVPTPLTEADQNLLIAYLQSGGNLIATGQDLTSASDIQPFPPDPRYGRSDLYQSYFGARFVQDDVYTNTATLERSAVGTSAYPWVKDMVLDLSAPGGDRGPSDQTGAGNQASIDEVTVMDQDPRMPDQFTTPILRAASTSNQLAGIIGLNRSAEPTLEQPARAIPYRSTYLAFGLEGVRNDTGATTRQDLLQRILYWHVDHPAIDFYGTVTVTDTNQLNTFTANAYTNTPATFVAYRWDFGDGSPVVASGQPTVVHRYERPGTYQVRVEATDSWGHREVSPGPTTPPPTETQPVKPQSAPSTGAGPQAGPKPHAKAFAETRQALQGRFLDYWRDNGGLQVFGMPLNQQQGEPLAQVFERNRFEYHPENRAPYDVLLSRLGAETLAAQGRDWHSFPTVTGASGGCLYFAETRHSLCGQFKAYWQQHGLEFDGKRGSSYAESLALFGLPLSEPQQETDENGAPITVQWFERARFEYHPENAAPYDVLLTRLGANLATSSAAR